MCVEARFSCRHRDAIGERKTEKDLEIDDAVHGAARSLDRFLKRIHRAGDVFLEGVGYENVVILGIAVIGTGSGEVVDTVVRMIAGARAPGAGAPTEGGACCAKSLGELIATAATAVILPKKLRRV